MNPAVGCRQSDNKIIGYSSAQTPLVFAYLRIVSMETLIMGYIWSGKYTETTVVERQRQRAIFATVTELLGRILYHQRYWHVSVLMQNETKTVCSIRS